MLCGMKISQKIGKNMQKYDENLLNFCENSGIICTETQFVHNI